MFDFLNLDSSQLLPLVKTVGYPTLLFFMIVEGPIITIIGSFLASLGIFNIFVVLFLSILGDIIGDMICYYIGFFGGSRALSRAEKFLKVKPQIISKMERLFKLHGFRTIFAVKSTTGLCWITFIAAGAVKMDIKKFLKGSVLGGIIWSSLLVLSGFFFGYAFVEISNYIKYAGIIIVILAVAFYLGIGFYRKYRSRKILSQNNNYTPAL